MCRCVMSVKSCWLLRFVRFKNVFTLYERFILLSMIAWILKPVAAWKAFSILLLYINLHCTLYIITWQWKENTVKAKAWGRVENMLPHDILVSYHKDTNCTYIYSIGKLSWIYKCSLINFCYKREKFLSFNITKLVIWTECDEDGNLSLTRYQCLNLVFSKIYCSRLKMKWFDMLGWSKNPFNKHNTLF